MDGKIIVNLSGRKKSNFFMKLLAFLLPFATFFGSVLCSWRYAALPVEAKSASFGIQINEFKYYPPVVDDVIDSFVDGDKGLNNPAAFNAINVMLNGGSLLGGSDVAASVEPVFGLGDRLRTDLGLPEGVEFVLAGADDDPNVKYLYTTAVNMGGDNSPNIPIGQPVFPVYRAKLVKGSDDKWVQEGPSKEGFAPSKFFVSGGPKFFGGGPTKTPFFDWELWRETKKNIQDDPGENPTGRSCYFAALDDISPDGNGNVSPVYMVRQNKDGNEWVNGAAPVKGWAPYVDENGFDHTSWQQGDPPA